MNHQQRRAREIEESIRNVLFHEWDPIGVAAESWPTTEYDAYIAGVYRLLARGASESEVAEHLAALERDEMGLTRSADALRPVARKLKAIDELGDEVHRRDGEETHGPVLSAQDTRNARMQDVSR